MSNLYINIRIGLYHFQLTNDWKFSIAKNESHRGYKQGFFKVYQFFDIKQLIGGIGWNIFIWSYPGGEKQYLEDIYQEANRIPPDVETRGKRFE